MNYTIEIYTDLKDKTNPTSGTKQETATTTGQTTYAGVYTIPLKAVVNLKPGTSYSVVVTTDIAAIDLEAAMIGDVNNNNEMVWENHASSDNTASYYFYGTGLAYSHSWNYKNVYGNFCIKAFTTNVYGNELGDRLGGYNLSLDGTIGVNFFMTLPDSLKNNPDAYMEFTLPNGTKSQMKVKDASRSRDYYVFTCRVTASNMTSEINAKMVSNGVAGKTYKYTVKQYATYIINHPNDYTQDAIKMVKSILNYGAAAQKLFNVNMDSLANSDLSSQDKSLANADYSNYKCTCTKDETVSGIKYYGSVLNLNTETCVKDFFLLENGVNINDYTFTYQISNGSPVTVQPYESVQGNKKCYGITIGNMKAYDLDKDIVVTVKKKGQTDSSGMKLKYGIFSYAYQVSIQENPDTNLVNLNKALYWYCINTRQYKYGH